VSQPDVITSEAAIRYADALIELAGETRGALKPVERDMKALDKMFQNSSDLTRMVRSPVIAADDKTSALQALDKKDKFNPLTVKFLGTVAQNLRAFELPEIVRAFADQLAKTRGTEIARVTSASKLSAAQTKQIKDKLTKELGKKVEVETNVDADLLGGFVVRIGSRLYDSSLRTQLDDLKLALKA
jgi:F-type H+-transporting ATPase subunit delta